MTNTTLQFGTALTLLVIAGMLVYLARNYLNSRSERRMLRMMRLEGVDPRFATNSDNLALMKQIRSRCRKCDSEGVCERWLAGRETGRNDFCPNARVFDELANLG